ncbi:MAG: cell division protein ZipA C-terminal FtsZ-binding domain-containing protein [Neisseriaceae bacterium]
MRAETIFLGILVFSILMVAVVVLYGIYQENQYRKEVFKQFGHTQKDVLMEEPVTQVRDTQEERLDFFASPIKGSQTDKARRKNTEERLDSPALKMASNQDIEASLQEFREGNLLTRLVHDCKTGVGEASKKLFKHPEADSALEGNAVEGKTPLDGRKKFVGKIEKLFPNRTKKSSLAVHLDELQVLDLPWFNKSFDYMAYITLGEPKELQHLPRLGGKHRVKIVGCTLDDQFQLAEAIPGVAYKAFVIGLQAISRSGLASKADLKRFGEQVQKFARSLGGECSLTAVDTFYEVAKPMDELCARVDQIIGLHLVSREMISGVELRATLERNGFVLSHDGAFYYPNYEEELFKLVNMDESAFTPTLLLQKDFKGFSMLFDITRVPLEKKYFDKFMGLAVKLANELRLDLVDDQLGELSAEWLKKIGSYVAERQKEMEAVGISPGGELAQRIFS